MPKEVLINKITSMSKETTQHIISEKNMAQLKAILSDLTMRKKREEDAELAKGWAASVADIRSTFDSLGVDIDHSANAGDGGDGQGSAEARADEDIKHAKYATICPTLCISGEDSQHEPRVVAATLTLEIFKKSVELQDVCGHIYTCGFQVPVAPSKALKLFVKPQAVVRLPFRGDVVPLCRTRTASMSVGQATTSKPFYQVTTSIWRDKCYDYFMIPGQNDLDLSGGSFVHAWAINKINDSSKKAEGDDKKNEPSMDAEDFSFNITIGTTTLEYKTRTMVFRTCNPNNSLVRLTRKPFAEEMPAPPSEPQNGDAAAEEVEVAAKRRRIMACHILA